jgi:hypothetical protein
MTRYSSSRGIMYTAPPETETDTTEQATEASEPAAADD